jgi:hypothetical protein
MYITLSHSLLANFEKCSKVTKNEFWVGTKKYTTHETQSTFDHCREIDQKFDNDITT